MSQATQLTQVVKGRYKGMVEEANKEKALKQVAEANLSEKTLELSSVQCRVTTTENAWEVAKKTVEQLQTKLDEIEVKLIEASNVISAWDKELADLKETLKNSEQVFCNMGFKDTENSARLVIFQS